MANGYKYSITNMPGLKGFRVSDIREEEGEAKEMLKGHVCYFREPTEINRL